MKKKSGATGAFAVVTTLFFGWGFVTSLVDPLVAAIKSIFSLSNVEAQLSAFAFFIAYGIFSLPAALLVHRLRAVTAIIVALAMMGLGCLGIIIAGNLASYGGVLAGLFVLAGGITVLQVAANPLAAILGAPEGAHFRLTLSQAFNSLGTVLGPLVGAHLFLQTIGQTRVKMPDTNLRRLTLQSIDGAFVGIALLIATLAVFIWVMRGRLRDHDDVAPTTYSVGAALRDAVTSRWTVLGGMAIFLYVGAEVSIGTQMALFLHDGSVWNIPLQRAGYYVSLYWLGAMIGRFAGSGLLLVLPAPRLLAVATAIASALCLFVATEVDAAGGYAALVIGLFNSIMFPTIFTLTLERSTAATEATSGFLCLSIVGGAFIPLLAGAVADAAGYHAAFLVPASCYTCLCGFALLAARGRIRGPHTDQLGAIAAH